MIVLYWKKREKEVYEVYIGHCGAKLSLNNVTVFACVCRYIFRFQSSPRYQSNTFYSFRIVPDRSVLYGRVRCKNINPFLQSSVNP
jgi:hypothetical protein